MKVKIYKPSQTVTQSGFRNSQCWVVEYPKQNDLGFDPLMGWRKSNNTQKQIQLKFDNIDQAIDYVKKNKLDYIIIPPKEKKLKIKNYSSNFKYNRID